MGLSVFFSFELGALTARAADFAKEKLALTHAIEGETIVYVRAVYANALGSKVTKHFIYLQTFFKQRWAVVRCLIMIYEHGSRMKQLPPFGWRDRTPFSV